MIFGDIGTSPLYTVATVLSTWKEEPTREDMLSVISMIFWSLTLVVS